MVELDFSVPDATLDEVILELEMLVKHKEDNQLAFFKPYPKQMEFISYGGQYRERAIFAGNQNGKTLVNCGEVSAHVTGLYPDWWPVSAKRFTGPTEFIIAGKTGQSTRDILQKKLLGAAGSISNLGTGMVPRSCIVVESKIASHGVGGGIDFIEIRHVSGGLSRLFFRTYAQGSDLFEGMTLSGGVIFDEEPGEEVYDEALMRIAATEGYLAIGFTPRFGRTKIVKRFLDQVSPDRKFVRMTIDDAQHFSPERREQMKRGCLPWLYKPRILGEPSAGELAVFPVDLETLKRQYPMLQDMPPEYFYLWGIDPGIGHPFAAVLIAYDRDRDIIHILKVIRVKDQTPLQHSYAMKQVAENVRVSWPKDAGARHPGATDLTSYIKLYKQMGLDMLPDWATNEDGSVGLEAGIIDIYQRMTTGRLFVNKDLTEWFEEARDYHRDDNGNIVPIDDDIMSAMRYACMMVKRKGLQGIPGRGKRHKRGADRAIGWDDNPLDW